jgi:hypothetical protein
MENSPLEVIEQPKQQKFTASIVQKMKDGNVIERGMSFELNDQQSVQPDIIVGTMMKRIFDNMDMAKAAKVKFLDSRTPISLRITASHVDIDFGNVEDWYSEKLKANSSARSKLALLDRLILAVNRMLTPIEGVRATVLAEDLRIEAIEKAGKDVKRIASTYHNKQLAGTVLTAVNTPQAIEPAVVENAGEVNNGVVETVLP